jgi:hypothetical protein
MTEGAAEAQIPESFRFAESLWRECRCVSEFISSIVRARTDAHLDQLTDSATILYGQFLRVDAWLRTLAKLNEPLDFQAVCSGCRALLENGIDMVLIHAAPVRWQELRAWEESAKLSQANALIAFYRRAGRRLDENCPLQTEYVRREADNVKGARLAYGWVTSKGKPTHPPRWTNRGLDVDARQADEMQDDFRFEEFYETRFRQLCWNTHGSGIVHRKVTAEMFPYVSGEGFHDCAELGVFCARLLLVHMNLWNVATQRDFERLNLKRTIVVSQHLPHAPAPLNDKG